MTEIELEELLIEYKKARLAILKGGQSYTINSGGSSRQVQNADLAEIERNINVYTQMLEELKGTKGFVVRAGW